MKNRHNTFVTTILAALLLFTACSNAGSEATSTTAAPETTSAPATETTTAAPETTTRPPVTTVWQTTAAATVALYREVLQ